eukprot:UN08479
MKIYYLIKHDNEKDEKRDIVVEMEGLFVIDYEVRLGGGYYVRVHIYNILNNNI